MKRFDFLFLLVFFLAFALRFHQATDFVMNDEVGGEYHGYGYLSWGYFDTAEAFRSYLSRGDFTGLYNWGLSRDANYPVVPFLMSVTMLSANSPTLTVARLPVEVSGALLAAFLYLLARDLVSKFAGLVSGLLAALDPVLITYSRVAYLDIPLELFFVISVWTLYHGLTKRSKLSIAFSGVTCALAVLSKIIGWLLLPFGLIMVVIWKSLNSEKLHLMAKYSAIFVLSFVFVLLAAFPWVGYEVLTGKYLWWYSSVSPEFSGGSYFGPTSITIFILGRLTPLELLAFGLGIIAAVWQFFRTRDKFAVTVILSWFLIAFSSLELMSVRLSHYMVFLIPPILLLSGYGVLKSGRIAKKLISMSGKFGYLQKIIKHPIIPSVALLLLVGGVQFYTVFQYYPYFSLYSSPLIRDPFQTFEIHGEEGIPVAVDFLRNYVPVGSTIAVAGQVHLFAYYLPEYKVVGLGELYPYSDEPIAFLYLSGITYLVVEMDFKRMFGKTDPVLQRLPSLQAKNASRVDDYDFIWIYDLSGIYRNVFSNILNEEWKCYQGNLSNGNGRFTLSVSSGYTYAYAIKKIDEVDPGSKVVLAWEMSDFTVDSIRIEMWSNESNIANLYPPKQRGIWTSDISEFTREIQSPLRLVLVAIGEYPKFLELKSLLILS